MRIMNDGGGLVLSDEGFGLNYLGKASFVQDEPAPDMNALSATPGAIKPTLKRYRITTPSLEVVPFLSLSARSCGIAQIIHSGTTWDFIVFNQDGSNTAAAIEIFCFGRPTTHSLYGIRIRKASDLTLAYELGMNRPLFYSAIVNLGAGITSAAIPSGIAKPAILGFNLGFIDPAWVLVNANFNRWRADAFAQGWALNGLVLARSERRFRQAVEFSEFGAGENPGNEDYRGAACTAYLIDATGLT